MNVIDLIKKLDAFMPSAIARECEEDGHDYITNADEIEDDACALFIKTGGRVNYDAIDEFNRQTKTYYVGPGETDSFGWLTGVIYTPKGMIVWG